MSRLKMSCAGVGSLTVNCTRFQSPLTGSITSAQTKSMLQHFPIKASQQGLQMDLQCRDWPELKGIQDFVRGHQKNAMGAVAHPEVILWWPERGIENWSGFIKRVSAGDRRFNVGPMITLEFLLIDSLLSQKTFGSSLASEFSSMFWNDIGKPSTRPPVDDTDGLIYPPREPGFIGPIAPIIPGSQPPRVGRGGGGTF